MYSERLPCVRLESPAAWAENRDRNRFELTLAGGGVALSYTAWPGTAPSGSALSRRRPVVSTGSLAI